MHLRIMRSVLALVICSLALVASRATSEPPERLSTLGDVRGVNLTIYNSDMALVHDRRRIVLGRGENRIAWRDTSGSLRPESAVVEDLTSPGSVHVVEQNFNYDLLGPLSVLKSFVGREVTVVHDRPEPGQARRETAQILADNDGLVLRYPDRIETGLYDSHLVFPSLPASLRDRPTLSLDIATDQSGAHDLDLAYLTNGLGWQADYVGTVSADQTRLDLRGLVTLTNTTGTTFANARLQLVAGTINAPELRAIGALRNVAVDRLPPAPTPPPMVEQSFFEYHLYTLTRPTTIANAQTKQVALLSARAIPVRETLELRGSPFYYENANADLGARLALGAYLTFENKGGELGIPLPAGVVRLYKNDAGGTSQYLGADRIEHTPRNETVRLHVGDSFDVTANKKQLTFDPIGACSYRSTYRIVISNAKRKRQEVEIVEPIPGAWTIDFESHPHVKTSSSTATWTLAVPADGSATLEYAARVTLCA